MTFRSFTQLPAEILLEIAGLLDTTSAISRLASCNRRLHLLLESHLYRYDMSTSPRPYKALTAALLSLPKDIAVRVAQKCIAAGMNVNLTARIHYCNDKYFVRRNVFEGIMDCCEIASVLGAAALCGHLEQVKLFTQAGSDINHYSKYGHSSISFAIIGGHVNLVEFFVKQPEIELERLSRQGRSILAEAVDRGKPNIARLLLSLVDPNLGFNGEKALWLAVMEGCERMLSLLLTHQDLRVNDFTAVAWLAEPVTAFAFACQADELALVRVLHDDNRVNVDLCRGDCSPAKLSLERDCTNIVNFLIKSNRSLTARDEIFRWACENDDYNLAKKVLNAAGTREQKYADAWTEAAAKRGLYGLVEGIYRKWGEC